MKYLILDIETVPFKIEHEDIREYLMDQKISKEQRSLDPNYSKIIMIGLKADDEPTKILSNQNEAELLSEFWNILRSKHITTKIVTHNGYGFDIPFIILRSIINKLNIPITINTNFWNMEKSNHFDTMVFFSHYGKFTNPNLMMLAKMHNIEIPQNRITGREIERFYKEGNLEIIKEHCKQDVEVLEKLFTQLCLPYLEKF